MAAPETHYTFLEEVSLKLQKRVSDIIRQVEFNHDTSDKNLMRAIGYDSPATRQRKDSVETIKQNASIPESQNASIPSKQQSSIPESQHAGNLERQQNITVTDKVTYRFHLEAKYAIEDINTILARKVGIKASFELIAEEAILIAYEELLENQHASKLAKRLSGMPEHKKTS